MIQANLAFLHTSPAAIAPLARYYAQHEPRWRVTNLLDDGILRLFQQADELQVEAAISSLIRRAVDNYGVSAVMITCSAVSLGLLRRLEARSPVPVVKIDVPMMQTAARQADRIGVLVSFQPTIEPTVALLRGTADALCRQVAIVPEFSSGAYDALLLGDAPTHDRLLHQAAERLLAQDVRSIVLAQVSMSHLRQSLESATGLPVHSCLETSHAALREVLDS